MVSPKSVSVQLVGDDPKLPETITLTKNGELLVSVPGYETCIRGAGPGVYVGEPADISAEIPIDSGVSKFELVKVDKNMVLKYEKKVVERGSERIDKFEISNKDLVNKILENFWPKKTSSLFGKCTKFIK